MKMSIHLIYEELFLESGVLSSVEEIIFNLSGVRLYRESYGGLSENHLYILTKDQFLSVSPDCNLSVICLGYPERICSSEKRDLPENWHGEDTFQTVIFLPEVSDPLDVLAQVQNLFDRYQQWENSINQAILHGKPLQIIFDLCGSILENPIALFDNQQILLMKTGTIPENVAGSIWDYVLKKGYSPKETEFESYLRTELKNNPKPFYFRSKDQYRKINRLIAGLHYRRTLLASLAMSDITAPFTKAEYARMCYIQEFMAVAFSFSDEYKSYLSETPWYISQLLQGNPVEKGVISYNLSLIGKKPLDSYCIWVLKPFDQTVTESFAIDDCLPSFKRNFKTDFVFNYCHQIVVFDYQVENYDQKSYLERIGDFLALSGFNGAFSMIFHDFTEIHRAYRQCQIAFESTITKNDMIYDFRKCYVHYILDCVQKNDNLDDLLYPGIRNLLQKDENYGLELLYCLQQYIIHGKNISAAAESLFVHRHTVTYRLTAISEIMRLDINSLDEDALLHLYLSCRILLHSK